MRCGARPYNLRGVSPVVGTILLVAITIVLVALLFVFAAGLLGGGTAGTPQLTFAGPQKMAPPGVWEITVAGTSRAERLSGYQMEVYNGTKVAIPAFDLDRLSTEVVEGGNLSIVFTDVGGAGFGKLTSGDTFRVSGIRDGHQYRFALIWTGTGDVVQWSTIG